MLKASALLVLPAFIGAPKNELDVIDTWGRGRRGNPILKSSRLRDARERCKRGLKLVIASQVAKNRPQQENNCFLLIDGTLFLERQGTGALL